MSTILFDIEASLANSQSKWSQSNDGIFKSFSTIWNITTPALSLDCLVFMRHGID